MKLEIFLLFFRKQENIIGALRSRSIHVQRRSVREAINAVDPVSRALRRTVTIIRRKYNVASPEVPRVDT